MVGSKNELYVFLDSLEINYENLYSRFQNKQKLNFLGMPSEEFDSIWITGKKIFLDTSNYNTIVEWRDRASSLADKELARRLELWHKTFLGGKLFFDPDLQQMQKLLLKKFYKIYNQNKGLTSIHFASRQQKQEHRKKIVDKYSSVYTELVSDYVRFVKLNNLKAKELGFHNYYSFLLYLDDINEAWLLETINNLDQNSRNKYYSLINQFKKKYKIDNPALLDIDPFTQYKQELGSKYFSGDSIVPKILQFMKVLGAEFDSAHINITTKKNLNQSRCFIINIPDNIELVIGTQPGFGAYHEALQSVSEAIFASSINVKYPILKGYIFIPGTANESLEKGAAQIFPMIFDDSLNLIREFHVAQKRLDRHIKMRTEEDLYKIRTLIYNFYLEYRLYQNPEQNIDSLASFTYNECLGDSNSKPLILKFIPTLEFINCRGDIYKNILKELISAQLHEGILNKFGSENKDSEKIAPWLIASLYREGETQTWQERIRIATGKSLEPGAFLRKLKIEQTNIITQ